MSKSGQAKIFEQALADRRAQLEVERAKAEQSEVERLKMALQSLGRGEPIALEFRDGKTIATIEIEIPHRDEGWSLISLREYLRMLARLG